MYIIQKMIDFKRVRVKVEERKKISNEAFLDWMSEMEELKRHGKNQPEKTISRHV